MHFHIREHNIPEKGTFHISHSKTYSTKFDLVGQLKVIIYINLVELPPKLHTIFKGNRPSGSAVGDFLRILSYVGMVAILVMRPGLNIKTYFPPLPGGK